MKKFALVITVLMLTLTGCGKKTPENLVGKFEKNVNSAKSYIIKGNMELLSNEETFTYSIEVNYLKDDYYKVTLVNQTNNHEQIILRNENGIYVVTPKLNKSFKFQSEWPENSSQSYILSSLLNDIKNDKNMTLENHDKGYVIKTKVNYPNNKELTYQKIYYDKDMNLTSVEVYNNNDIVNIKVDFSSINLKANVDKDTFKLEHLIDTTKNDQPKKDKNSTNDNSNNEKETNTSETSDNSTTENCENEECDKKSSNTIESIIYPLYIPSQTYLSNSEKIDTDDGDRVILTFAGSKNFVLIEEVATVAEEFEIIPVYGDPVMLSDTIAAKSTNSMYWTSDGLSYYLTSSDLSTEEMVTIAESLGNIKTVANIK